MDTSLFHKQVFLIITGLPSRGFLAVAKMSVCDDPMRSAHGQESIEAGWIRERCRLHQLHLRVLTPLLFVGKRHRDEHRLDCISKLEGNV